MPAQGARTSSSRICRSGSLRLLRRRHCCRRPGCRYPGCRAGCGGRDHDAGGCGGCRRRRRCGWRRGCPAGSGPGLRLPPWFWRSRSLRSFWRSSFRSSLRSCSRSWSRFWFWSRFCSRARVRFSRWSCVAVAAVVAVLVVLLAVLLVAVAVAVLLIAGLLVAGLAGRGRRSGRSLLLGLGCSVLAARSWSVGSCPRACRRLVLAVSWSPPLWLPLWAALMASMRSPLRIPVALMPSPPASCLSSGSNMAFRPPLRPPDASCAGGGSGLGGFGHAGSFPLVGCTAMPSAASGAVRPTPARDPDMDVSGIPLLGGDRFGVWCRRLRKMLNREAGRGRFAQISTRAPGPPTDCRQCLPPGRDQLRDLLAEGVDALGDEGEHRRAGPGDDRRDAPSIAAASTSASDSGMAGSRCCWCRKSSVARSSSSGLATQCRDEQGGPTGVGRSVGVRHLVGQQATGELGAHAVRRDKDHRRDRRVDWGVLGPHDVAGLAGDDEPAEQGRGHVVGMALEPVGQGQRLPRRRAVRPRRRRARAPARCRRRSPRRTSPCRGCAGSGWCRTDAGREACSPSSSKAARMARTTRWDSSRARSSPSPSTCTSRPSASTSPTRVSVSSRARPRQS